MSENHLIDLYYGDESRVSLEPCIPYGWQFADEEVFMPMRKGGGLNCFALLTRGNQCLIETTEQNINSRFIFDRLESLSTKLKKLTVIVLDNARIHTSKIIKERIKVWRRRGLYIFYLPRYSPHLNIVETLWRKLKYEWLSPSDYQSKENLFYQIRLALTTVGRLADSTVLKVRVSRNSTVWVKSKLYSVPSQLIGEWVNVELYAERLEVRYGDVLIEQIERVRGVGASAINYRHIIHSLVRKPEAFERFRHRQQLFPQFIFRVVYDRLGDTMPARADQEYLRILEMAALTGEEMVAAALDGLFEKGLEISAASVAARLDGQRELFSAPIRLVMPVKVELADYDRLLESGHREAGQ